MRSAVLRRSLAAIARVRARLALSVAATLALAAGLVILGATTVVFGGVTEDVTRRNGLSTSDPLHLRWFTEHRPHMLVSVARVFSEVGSPATLALVAVVAAIVLWLRRQRLLLAIAPGLALGIGGIGAAIGKTVVARGRPPVPLHLVSETDASFPSGHATDATAVYLTLALIVAIYILRRPLARFAWVLGSGLLAAAVGASRLVLGVHWPTDVIAGWTLGASVALAVTIVASLATRAAPNGPAANRNSRPLARVAYLMTRERRPRSLQAT